MTGIPPQWVKGETSRQAHVRLPAGTVEDEHGRGGFYGPASHLYRLAPADRLGVGRGPGRPPRLRPPPRRGRRRPVADARARQPATCRSAGTASACRTAPSSSATPTATSCTSCTPARACCAPSTGRSTTGPATTCCCRGARPTGSSRRRRPTCSPSRRRGSGSRCPTAARSAATPCSTRRSLDVPEPEAIDEEGEFVVVVKRGGHDTRVHLPLPPVRRRRVEGRPRAAAAARRRPPSRRVAPLPPAAVGALDASWRPASSCARSRRGRWRSDPEAIRLPFFHRNVDYDEVLFYHRGEFFSRAGIDAGMLTFHPCGLHHGPQPGRPRARRRGAAAAATADGAARGSPTRWR